MTLTQSIPATALDPINVLFVDDDLYGTNKLILELEYDEEIALTIRTTPKSALQHLVNYPADVVVADRMIVPRRSANMATEEGFLSGAKFVQNVKRASPRTKVIMISNAAPDDFISTLQRAKIIDKYYWKHQITPGILVDSVKRLHRSVCTPARTFIVHGHDDELITELKNFVRHALGWPLPSILADLPSVNRTIIEKFEAHAADTDVIFVLLTSNDDGPRRNVMFELGYFWGMFGRRSGRVILLKKGDVEIPSDLHGIITVDVTQGLQTVRELLQHELPYYF